MCVFAVLTPESVLLDNDHWCPYYFVKYANIFLGKRSISKARSGYDHKDELCSALGRNVGFPRAAHDVMLEINLLLTILFLRSQEIQESLSKSVVDFLPSIAGWELRRSCLGTARVTGSRHCQGAQEMGLAASFYDSLCFPPVLFLRCVHVRQDWSCITSPPTFLMSWPRTMTRPGGKVLSSLGGQQAHSMLMCFPVLCLVRLCQFNRREKTTLFQSLNIS